MRIAINLLIILLVSTSCNTTKKEKKSASDDTVTTTYYLIRHAEKDRSDPSNKNPELSIVGIERAKKWAVYFENLAIDQIFSTDYKRTMQTAAYTASQKQVMVESYDPNDLFNEDFRLLTHGSNVLIVGHSNTTPKFVNAIIGENKYSDIDDNDNSLLYRVTVTGEEKNVEVVSIN